jgi:hypothetical protein
MLFLIVRDFYLDQRDKNILLGLPENIKNIPNAEFGMGNEYPLIGVFIIPKASSPFRISPSPPVDSLKNVTERDRWLGVEVWKRRGRFF